MPSYDRAMKTGGRGTCSACTARMVMATSLGRTSFERQPCLSSRSSARRYCSLSYIGHGNMPPSAAGGSFVVLSIFFHWLPLGSLLRAGVVRSRRVAASSSAVFRHGIPILLLGGRDVTCGDPQVDTVDLHRYDGAAGRGVASKQGSTYVGRVLMGRAWRIVAQSSLRGRDARL